MKLTNVEIHAPPSGPTIDLSFRDPQTVNPYNVKSILGLDADELIVKHGETSTGVKLHNLALKHRNVVMQIGLNPNYANHESYSDLRDALYRVIASTRTGLVELRFRNDTTTIAAISGFITKFESDLFEKDLEIQITLSCKESMLKSMTRVGFPLIGNPTTTVLQDDKSTAPHGFTFILEFTDAVGLLTIGSSNLESNFIIGPRGGFVDGDRLYFSSEFDNRYIYMTRGATVIHLADVVYLNSVWPLIFPGENIFLISSGSSSFFVNISHYETYWGV